MKRLFILAGELSGDTHGAGLMRELIAQDPEVKFQGLGGPQMKALAPAGIDNWVEHSAVVGLVEPLKRYGFFKEKFNACLEVIGEEKPDAVVLVDYPGFNLRLAKAIREQRFQTKILYYISPQVWAWKKGRIKTMARVLDLMICIFPFEKPLYEKSGLRTEFAGHPMVDRVKGLSKRWPREPGLVGWFPGSREDEVRRLFPVMVEAAKIIKQARPAVRFAVSAANEGLANMMRTIADEMGQSEAKRWIETGSVYDLMQRAEVGAVASGTATLEAACFGLPYALVYRIAWPTYVLGKLLVRIKHLGIINILAGKEVVPEFIQHECTPEKVGRQLLRWLEDAECRWQLQEELARTVAMLGEGGAYQRAGSEVLKQLA